MKFRLFAIFATAVIFVGATFLAPQSFAWAKPQAKKGSTGHSGDVNDLLNLRLMEGLRVESGETKNDLKGMQRANDQKQQLRNTQTKPKR
jgi:hypothetical protein